MLLLFNSSNNKLKTSMLAFLYILLIGNAITAATNDTSKVEEENTTTSIVAKTQKTFKKELKVNIKDDAVVEITPPAKDDHTEKLVIIDDESIIETSGKGLEQPLADGNSKDSERSGLLETATKAAATVSHMPYQHHVDEEFVLHDVDDMSESLKTGFYFFLILSSAAIVFILFKIYRLRLSRAERKYGVQGDRSTQELTPLPISIEDGHSDDEDQTLFEVQRQNIRIL